MREWEEFRGLSSFSSAAELAQTCHDDRVVKLNEQLVVEEVDGEGTGRKSKGRREEVGIKESAPWMVTVR